MSNYSHNDCRHEWREVEGEPYKQCIICCEYAAGPAMSNDSNEQGNAAAGQTAFQVGDRVRTLAHFPLENLDTEIAAEVVAPLNSLGYLTIHGAGDNWMRRPDQLTLISRVAFGIGDRVRYADVADMKWREAVIEGLHGDEAILKRDRDGERRWVGLIRLELISRATPAPAPAGYSSDDAVYECPNPGCEMVTVTPVVRASDGALCCPECKTRIDEPATTAPAAYRAGDVVITTLGGRAVVTNPGGDGWYWLRDIQGRTVCKHADDLTLSADQSPLTAPAATPPALELPVRYPCDTCLGTGRVGPDLCGECNGGWRHQTLCLSDEAVDRLAGVVAKRMREVRQ